MTHSPSIIRFEENGPNGLFPMELDPADFHDVPDAQNVHVYFEDQDLGFSTGVWDTTTMHQAF